MKRVVTNRKVVEVLSPTRGAKTVTVKVAVFLFGKVYTVKDKNSLKKVIN